MKVGDTRPNPTHIRIKGELGTVKHVYALQYSISLVFLLWILFIIYVSCLSKCYAVLSVPCTLVITCCKWAGPALLCIVFLCFCHFPIRCSWSGMVLECIDS